MLVSRVVTPSLPAPEGRQLIARGVSPWSQVPNSLVGPKGRQSAGPYCCRPFGAVRFVRYLPPGAHAPGY